MTLDTTHAETRGVEWKGLKSTFTCLGWEASFVSLAVDAQTTHCAFASDVLFDRIIQTSLSCMRLQQQSSGPPNCQGAVGGFLKHFLCRLILFLLYTTAKAISVSAVLYALRTSIIAFSRHNR
jgi:hypothetical protein